MSPPPSGRPAKLTKLFGPSHRSSTVGHLPATVPITMPNNESRSLLRFAPVLAIPIAFVAAVGVFCESPLREAHLRDDFTLREEMVPMRDGVKLYTLILTPKAVRGPIPILLERTPY